MQETWIWSLGWKDPLEEAMATHSGILAWRSPWTEEPGRLQSMGSQRVGYDWATKHSTQLRISANAYLWVVNFSSEMVLVILALAPYSFHPSPHCLPDAHCLSPWPFSQFRISFESQKERTNALLNGEPGDSVTIWQYHWGLPMVCPWQFPPMPSLHNWIIGIGSWRQMYPHTSENINQENSGVVCILGSVLQYL